MFCGSDELTALDSNSCIFLPENFDNPCGSASANKWKTEWGEAKAVLSSSYGRLEIYVG